MHDKNHKWQSGVKVTTVIVISGCHCLYETLSLLLQATTGIPQNSKLSFPLSIPHSRFKVQGRNKNVKNHMIITLDKEKACFHYKNSQQTMNRRELSQLVKGHLKFKARYLYEKLISYHLDI